MDEAKPRCAFTPQGPDALPCRERRRHPRTPYPPAEQSEASTASPDRTLQQLSPVRRILGRLGLPRPAADAAHRRRAVWIAGRRARLFAIADRLEAILRELDALEAWREAADVCSAIERLKSLTEG